MLHGRIQTAYAVIADHRLSLRRSSPELFPPWRLAAFLAGMFSLWIAIGSPLSAFDEASLTVHMIQHILLMLVVPPLVLLGAPSLPLLHGLPQGFVRTTLGPFFRWPGVQSLGKFLTHPLVCWIFASVARLVWHVPSAFELALRSDAWHELEHFCFLSTSILFWWPVVQPFPSESRWPRWTIPLYLFFGTFPGGALGAFLVFCDRVLYPSYMEAPSLFGITPLVDQIFAGSLMWVFGLFVLVLPGVFITFHLLSPLDPGYPSQLCHAARNRSATMCNPTLTSDGNATHVGDLDPAAGSDVAVWRTLNLIDLGDDWLQLPRNSPSAMSS